MNWQLVLAAMLPEHLLLIGIVVLVMLDVLDIGEKHPAVVAMGAVALARPTLDTFPQLHVLGAELARRQGDLVKARAEIAQLKTLNQGSTYDLATDLCAHGKPVLFLHPKDFCGTLVEIEQV